MLSFVALSALASSPVLQPVGLEAPAPVRPEKPARRGRIAIPPMDVGLGVVGRLKQSYAPTFVYGVEVAQWRSFGVRAGLRVDGSSQLLEATERGSGWIERRVASTGVDVAPRLTVVDGMQVEAVGGVAWRTFRQQYVTIDTVAVPTLGVGLQLDFDWVGVRTRIVSDLVATRAGTPDGVVHPTHPVGVELTAFFRFPGTRDPFHDVPTLHR
ncbi:MAG: hypothetical protein R3F61_00410 [Myxococcota bacterium]